MKHSRHILMTAMAIAAMPFLGTGCSTKASAMRADDTAISGSQTREYKVSAFTKIEGYSTLSIHFTQGSKTSVRAACTRGDINWLSVKTRGETLVIEIPEDHKDNQRRRNFYADVYVTAPTLTGIDIAGHVKFDAGTLEAKKLAIDLSGIGTVDIKKLKSDNTDITLSGIGTLNANIEGGSLTMENSGNAKSDITFRGQKAKVENSGVVKLALKFTGDDIDIDNSGVSNTTFDVSCKKLRAINSGNATLTLKGSADDTKIDNSGVSKINTEELNRF